MFAILIDKGVYEYGRLGDRELTTPRVSSFLDVHDVIDSGLRHVVVLRNGIAYATGIGKKQTETTQQSNGKRGADKQAGAAEQNGGKREADETYTELARGVAEVCAGGEHAVLLREDGTVWGIGCNRDGQLGLGEDESDVPVLTQIPQLKNVAHIACGGDFTIVSVKSVSKKPDPSKDCAAVASDAGLVNFGFGWNGMQQLLDDPAQKEIRVPTALPYRGVPHPSKYSHTMYIDRGDLYGVGGFFRPGSAGVRLRGVSAASGGLSHAVLVAGGDVFAAGDNTLGQVGTDEA